MTLTEQKLWNLIKSHLPGSAGRVENSVDDGTPDINCTCFIDYWIELKVCSNKNKIRDVTKLLRDTQIIWHMKRGKEGALIFVIVRYPKEIVIYKWERALFNNTIESLSRVYVILSSIQKKGNEFEWAKFNLAILSQIQERINKNGLCDSRTTR